MTRARLLVLAERRSRLAERARVERETLAALVALADDAVSWLGMARQVLEELRRSPLIVAAGAAFLIALRPRRALTWLARGWSLWRLYRGARRWWLRVAAAAAAPAGAHKPG